MHGNRGFAFAVACAAAMALTTSPSHAQSTPVPATEADPNEPSGFEIAYSMSFIKYDACDDHVAGQIFRRAVLERFKRCSFPKEVNDKFHDWLIEELESIATGAWQAAAERLDVTPHSDFPDGISTCKQYRESPVYLEKRALLLKYQRHEVDLDAVMDDDCSLGPAAL